MTAKRNLLIFGATGQQGRNTIKALVASPQKDDFIIWGLTRDPNSEASKKLSDLSPNVRMIVGGMEATEETFAAVDGPVWGLFLLGIPLSKGQTPEKEVEQGKATFDLAVKHGVSHVVFMSVDRGGKTVSDTTPTVVPHFASKLTVENYIKANLPPTMTYTFLRPVAFYENLTNDMNGRVGWKIFNMVLGDQKKMQLVAISDIGWFGAQSFIQHDSPDYKNQAIGIAGCDLTKKEMDQAFRNVLGKEFPQGSWLIAKGLMTFIKELGIMFTWFGTDGYGVDLAEVKRLHPDVKDFETWLRTESTFKP